MIIFNNTDEIDIKENTAVALGNFDGLHAGHMELVRTMKKAADREGSVPAVFTFSNHPSALLTGEKVPEIIYAEEKARLLEEAGVEYLFNIPFTDEIRSMTAEQYVKDLLIGKFKMKDAICGFNYRFGKKASGDTELFRKMSSELGFGLHVVPPFKIDGKVVSSTLIRQAIMDGDMKEASVLLGRQYSIKGTVIEGNRLGRTIGFPTCNISVDEGMVAPSNGVYQTSCVIDGRRYASVTNVGVKPTIGEYEKNIETNIFDFDKEVYGHEIEVFFIDRIREERKFSGLEELKGQIAKDREKALLMHEKHA